MSVAPRSQTANTHVTAALVAVLLGALAWSSPAAEVPPGDRLGDGERTPRIRPLTFTLELVLETGPTFRNGLGVAIAFDGGELEFEGVDGLEAKGLLGASGRGEPDEADVDGDERTDRLVRLAWLLPGGGWETPGKDVVLGRAIFRQRRPSPPRNWAEAPAVAVVSLSADRKGWFPDRHVTLTAAQKAVRIVGAGTVGTVSGLSVVGAPGNDSGSRPFVLGRFQAHRPAELEMARQATGAILPCNLDVDGNSIRDALTDGLLLHRYLFGFTGTALVSDGLGTGATRTDGAAIAAFLAQSDCGPMLDVDANGSPDALTDGLLAVRYLFGFSGDALVAGATGVGATRTAGESVANFLEYCDNPRQVAIQASLTPGQAAQDEWGEVQVKSVDVTTAVTVVVGVNEAGERTVDVRSSNPGTLELTLPDPNDLLPPSGVGRLARLRADELTYHDDWGGAQHR